MDKKTMPDPGEMVRDLMVVLKTKHGAKGGMGSWKKDKGMITVRFGKNKLIINLHIE